MLEPQRSQYLRALGIDVYVPRLILPGALASQSCEWTEAASLEIETPAAAIEQIAAVLTPVSAVVRQRSLPDAVRIDPSAPAVNINSTKNNVDSVDSETRVAVAAPLTESNAAPKIALSVIVAGNLLIVDDAPSGTAMRGDYLRLLTNILFALHWRTAQPQLDVFLWPMAKHPQLDQGAQAARETLAAHLHKQIQQHAIDTVLLLGESAQTWCAIGADDALRCVRSVSALACLRAPDNKRQLWHDLRHLAVAH